MLSFRCVNTPWPIQDGNGHRDAKKGSLVALRSDTDTAAEYYLRWLEVYLLGKLIEERIVETTKIALFAKSYCSTWWRTDYNERFIITIDEGSTHTNKSHLDIIR